MFQYLADEIVLFMIRHKWLEQSKREIYVYAIEVLFLNGGLLIINFCLSLIFNKSIVFVSFLIFFVLIRKYLGGYHLKSSGTCMICSIVFYILSLLVSSILYSKYENIEVVLLCFLVLVCAILQPLSRDFYDLEIYKLHNKKIANIIIVVDAFIILVIRRIGLNIVPSALFFENSALLFFLIAKLENKIKLKDSTDNMQ